MIPTNTGVNPRTDLPSSLALVHLASRALYNTTHVIARPNMDITRCTWKWMSKRSEQAVSKSPGNSGGLKIYLATYRVRYAEFTYVTICTDCSVYIPRIEMKIFQRGELEMITPSNPVRISLFFVYSVYVCLRVGLNSWNSILPDWDVEHVGWWYLVSCSNRSWDLSCVPGVQLLECVYNWYPSGWSDYAWLQRRCKYS